MAEIVSSRTREGRLDQCPLCESEIRLEPSLPFGDAPCPQCGVMLWFVRFDGETRYYEGEQAEAIRERLRQLIRRNLGLDVPAENDSNEMLALLKQSQMDSLDLVELVMEFEEGFDLSE